VLAHDTILIGRRASMAALDTAREEVLTGSARRVTITGRHGIGKTRLLDEIAARAAGDGWSVLRATGDPLDAVQPLAALVRALGAGADRTDERERLFTGSVIGGNVAERRFRDESRIVELVSDLTTGAPVLLAIDDADLVDDSTGRLLDRLVDLLADRRLLVVSTRSTGGTAQALDDGGLHLELTPLSDAEVEALVATVAGRPMSALPTRARASIDAAQGIPLHLVLILADLLREDSGAAEVGAPDARSSLRATIGRLPPDTVDALYTVAIVGRSIDFEELLAMRTEDPLAVHRAIGVAVDAGLVRVDGGRVTIRNALVADELVGQIPVAVRRSVHGRFAAILAERRAPAARIAHHAVRASDTTSQDAVALLLDGGRDVGSRAPTLALELLQQAAELAEPDDPRRVDVLIEMVAALGWTGEFDRCEATARSVLAQPIDDTRRAAMRRALALCAFLQNRATTAAEECERSVAESSDATLRARALGEAALARMAAADLVAAHARAVEAVEEGARADEPISGCVGWSVRSRLHAFELDLAQSLELAERAIAIARRDPTGEATLYHPGFFRLLTLIDLDQLDDARVELERERSIGDRSGLAWTLPLHHGLAAVVHLFSGRLADATTAAHDGMRAVESVGSALAAVWLHAAAAMVALHQGDTALARRRVDQGKRVLAIQVPLLGVDLLALAEARLLEAEGDRHTARDTLHGALQLFESMGMSNCSRLIAPDVARLAATTGRDDVMDEACRLLADLAARTDLPIDRAQATIAAATLDRDPEQALAAVALADESPRVLERATIREAAADVLWVAGRRSEAAQMLSVALDLDLGLGASGDAARVRRRFADLGLRRPRSRAEGAAVALTHRESMIADLVSLGRTNAEVAEHLGISARTVETHLTRVYAKLGLRSRTELAASARERLLRVVPGTTRNSPSRG
jgi:DNA-binding CsgD family transcriptional regulator